MIKAAFAVLCLALLLAGTPAHSAAHNGVVSLAQFQTACKAAGFQWSGFNNSCRTMDTSFDKAACLGLGAQRYNACGSACPDAPPETMCPAVCVPTCYFTD